MVLPTVDQNRKKRPTVDAEKITYTSPLPNISTLAILISPRKSPKTPKWGPQNEFPGITRTKGFCGTSTETLNFPEFPGPSRFRIFGSPFSTFWGEMKLICWAVLTYTKKSVGELIRAHANGVVLWKGVLLPSRCLLESPFLEPLLRTLLRTTKTHCKTASKNPS